MTGHRNGFRRCFVWIMLFCAGWSGAVLAAGPERPKARPGELIVYLRVMPASAESVGGASTAGASNLENAAAAAGAAHPGANPTDPGAAVSYPGASEAGAAAYPPGASEAGAGARAAMQAALAVRSAASIAADPQRPASLRALDAKFGLREGKPLFPPTVRMAKRNTDCLEQHSRNQIPLQIPLQIPHQIPPSYPPASGGKAPSPPAPSPLAGRVGEGYQSWPRNKEMMDSSTDRHGLETPADSAHSSFILPPSSLFLLRFDPAVDLEAARKAYAADPNVLYAEPNWEGALCYAPTDPLYAQTASDLAIIGMEEAWAVQPGCGTGVPPVVPPVVAVIDSGVEPYHPDLAPALDLANSWNFIANNANVFDDLGHGTRVAGIIGAAGNNAEGIAGVAFGCRLLSLDVTTSAGVVTTADVASAINWAVARGAGVVNMSLRFSGASQTLQNACDSAAAAGVLLVAAAGNENQGDLPVYPASYDSVIGVGAVMDDGAARAPFSNYNNLQKNLVELVAPGSTVFSTIPGSQYNGTYGSGTSFAAPMVSSVEQYGDVRIVMDKR